MNPLPTAKPLWQPREASECFGFRGFRIFSVWSLKGLGLPDGSGILAQRGVDAVSGLSLTARCSPAYFNSTTPSAIATTRAVTAPFAFFTVMDSPSVTHCPLIIATGGVSREIAVT